MKFLIQNHKAFMLCIAIFPLALSTTWVLSWSDEFNSANIDTSKWNWEIGNNNGWGNNELEYYTDSSQNSFIQNDCLVIQALKQDYQGFQYTSARMTTQNKFSTIYGRFEMSAKLPFGQGIWPAFWLLGDNINQVGWPACGEIDIMEWIGKNPTQVFGSLHLSGADFSVPYTDQGGFSSNFHNYSVNWQPNSITYYVDDVLYETITPSETNGQWPFNQNFFILLNLAVGGNWPGNPDSSTQFPQQYIIDYVRVYELCFTCN